MEKMGNLFFLKKKFVNNRADPNHDQSGPSLFRLPDNRVAQKPTDQGAENQRRDRVKSRPIRPLGIGHFFSKNKNGQRDKKHPHKVDKRDVIHQIAEFPPKKEQKNRPNELDQDRIDGRPPARMDGSDALKKQPIDRHCMINPRPGKEIKPHRPERRGRNQRRDQPPAPRKNRPDGIRCDRLRTGQNIDRQQAQVGNIAKQVTGRDDNCPKNHGPRDRSLRVLGLAGEETRVLPAAKTP